MQVRSRWRLAPADEADEEGHHGHDHEDEEKDLRDLCRSSGNAAKAEERRNQGDDKEDDGVMQHGGLQFLTAARISATVDKTTAPRLARSIVWSHHSARQCLSARAVVGRDAACA